MLENMRRVCRFYGSDLNKTSQIFQDFSSQVLDFRLSSPFYTIKKNMGDLLLNFILPKDRFSFSSFGGPFHSCTEEQKLNILLSRGKGTCI